MKIGILSDSHGNVDALKKTFNMFGDVCAVLHAGDILYHPPKLQNYNGYHLMESVEFLNSINIPIISVKGNCDSEVYTELLKFDTEKHTTTYNFNGINILINHGHNINDMTKVSLAKDLKAQIFLSGHTHIPVLEKKDNVILLNPGSISIPRYPFNEPDPTACIIEDKNIKILSINTQKVYFEYELN